MYKILIVSLLIQCMFVSAQENDAGKKGIVHGPFKWKSKIYPGTERNYWIYAPSQYDSTKPTCLIVVQDGLSRAVGWRLPIVLDSLISKKEIPVMIGLFVDPGTVQGTDTSFFPRFNRSFEYDALGDRYARFLVEELIPEVNRSYNLSKDPNDRAIAGASSGAICAFNVAWERPDAFRRVFSSIGTYVGLRGANEFPTLVRKMEPKPLRIFLQDGTRDNNIYAGDWWVANQDMLSALTWAGYEVTHAWGEGGGHDSKHTTLILPEGLKWLWKDYPAAITTHGDSVVRTNPLLNGQSWQEIPLKNTRVGKLAIHQSGNLFFADGQSIYQNDKNSIKQYATVGGKIGGISFYLDGKLFVGNLSQHKIISIDKKGNQTDVLENVDAEYLTVSSKGIYFSEAGKKRVGFYSFKSRQNTYSNLPGIPSGLSLSSEQTFLNLGFENKALGYSFQIMEDGNLGFGQEYIHYHLSYGEISPHVTGLVSDTANLVYSATKMGIQMSDQLGRINFIISKPSDNITDIKIGGQDFNVLYASCNGRLFQRKINSKGVQPWLAPVKPPRPRM